MSGRHLVLIRSLRAETASRPNRRLLARSVLIENGYVRWDAVQRILHDARWGRRLPPTVYDMLALDIGIRSMITTPRRFEEP